MAKIDAFFKLMHEQGASDLHLVAGQPPALRIRGEVERVKYKVLTSDDLRAMLYEIAPEHKIKVFEETGDVDFGYEIPGLARYRANFFNQKNGVGAVFREIPNTIMTAEQLGLPPVVSKLAMLPRGLVLVTGPTGSGKSTTLAAVIDIANKNRKDHIITVEDPIEFVHESQSCLVNHREVGIHTKSFSAPCAGRCARTPTSSWSAKCATSRRSSWPWRRPPPGTWSSRPCTPRARPRPSTGSSTCSPPSEQNQIRSTLSDGIRAVIAQNLFKRIDKKGRVVALEILVFTPGGAQPHPRRQDPPDPLHDPDREESRDDAPGRCDHGALQARGHQRRGRLRQVERQGALPAADEGSTGGFHGGVRP